MPEGDIQRALGRIEGKLDGLNGHIDAVSANQKKTQEKLDKHLEDVGAHGQKARGDVWGTVGRILTLVLGVSGLGIGLAEFALKVAGR